MKFLDKLTEQRKKMQHALNTITFMTAVYLLTRFAMKFTNIGLEVRVLRFKFSGTKIVKGSIRGSGAGKVDMRVHFYSLVNQEY
jgi:hypothetical protein